MYTTGERVLKNENKKLSVTALGARYHEKFTMMNVVNLQ